MKNKRKLWLISGAVAVVGTVLLAAFLNFLPMKKAKIECFVYDPCGGCFTDGIPCKPCKVVLEMESLLFDKIAAMGLRDLVEIRVYNTMYEDQKKLLDARVEQGEEWSYPVIFVNDTALFGWNEIHKRLAETLEKATQKKSLCSGKSNSEKAGEFSWVKAEIPTVVYFKKENCASCKKAEEFLAREENFGNSCKVISYSLENAPTLRMFEEYCKKYKVDAQTAGAPMIFIGDAALEGFAEIETFLKTYIEKGYGSKTSLLHEK